jgi:hypothetical protein
MTKRTTIDFSKHEVIITKSEGLLVHDLKLPHSFINSIKFINTQGILAITGDFGNWIFCREFHPSADGYVSAGYWCEKLRIASIQKSHNFSVDETEIEIKRLLAEEEDLSEKEVDYLNGCLNNVDDWEIGYRNYAFTENAGRFEDGEYVPYEEELNIWLAYIFDGFEEICKRMKNDETSST